MKNTIKSKKKFLSFRNHIDEIKKEIKDNNFTNVTLDFSEVIFISRSSADELLNMLEEFTAHDIKIQLKNLNPDVKKMIDVVKKRKKKIREALSGQ